MTGSCFGWPYFYVLDHFFELPPISLSLSLLLPTHFSQENGCEVMNFYTEKRYGQLLKVMGDLGVSDTLGLRAP